MTKQKLLPCLCGVIPDIEHATFFRNPCKIVCSNPECPVRPRLKVCSNRNLAIQTWNHWIIEGTKTIAYYSMPREKLAFYAHEAWSGWMKYLFKKSTKNDDGTIIIPKWAVDRWKKQSNTTYVELSETEKNSDREEADKMINIFKEFHTII